MNMPDTEFKALQRIEPGGGPLDGEQMIWIPVGYELATEPPPPSPEEPRWGDHWLVRRGRGLNRQGAIQPTDRIGKISNRFVGSTKGIQRAFLVKGRQRTLGFSHGTREYPKQFSYQTREYPKIGLAFSRMFCQYLQYKRKTQCCN